jgi:hypothetical protein
VHEADGCLAGETLLLEGPPGLLAVDLATLQQHPIALGSEWTPRLITACASRGDTWLVPVARGHGSFAPVELLVMDGAQIRHLQLGKVGFLYGSEPLQGAGTFPRLPVVLREKPDVYRLVVLDLEKEQVTELSQDGSLLHSTLLSGDSLFFLWNRERAQLSSFDPQTGTLVATAHLMDHASVEVQGDRVWVYRHDGWVLLEGAALAPVASWGEPPMVSAAAPPR